MKKRLRAPASSGASVARNRIKGPPLTGNILNVKVERRGPDSVAMNGISKAMMEDPRVRKFLGRARHRVLSLELTEPETQTKPSRIPPPPDRYRATIYDYTNNRTVFVDGIIGKRGPLKVTASGIQPLPNHEEFEAAVQLLSKEPKIGPAIAEKRLKPYPAMPPLIEEETPDGRVERTLAIGLLPSESGLHHEIVGVNMIRELVVRYEGRAPTGAAAHNPICGLPYAGQPTTARGTAGQAWVTVKQGNTVLWKFLVVRPAASSGTRASAVELRYVDYRGKRVLYQAHVPILNVRYDADACGPYRDWQWQEGMIVANGQDVLPGFRLCPTSAQTILDSGSDSGNYLGVAIYVQGQEVVLVSELEAGWYRYISEWRLHANGTIRPRFGFSGTQNSCVCNRHYHHPYWRFDFDIRTPWNNRVREFNDPAIFPKSHWHTKYYEIRRPRDPGHHRKWRVENTVSGEGYDVIPGTDDGVATLSPDWPYPRGDVWILRYHANELDDGHNVTTDGAPGTTEAGLDTFLDGEAISNNDVVIWYAAHVTHDVSAEPPGTYGHIAGPTLKPVNW